MSLRKSEIQHKFREVYAEGCEWKTNSGIGLNYCQVKYRNRCKEYKNETINWDCPRDCPKIQDDIFCDLKCTFLNVAWKKFKPVLTQSERDSKSHPDLKTQSK